jgi:hypothetical protein
MQEPHQARVGERLPLRLELCAVVAPLLRKIDTGPRVSVVVKIDEPTLAHGPKRPRRSIQATWRKLHVRDVNQPLAAGNRRSRRKGGCRTDL